MFFIFFMGLKKSDYNPHKTKGLENTFKKD